MPPMSGRSSLGSARRLPSWPSDSSWKSSICFLRSPLRRWRAVHSHCRARSSVISPDWRSSFLALPWLPLRRGDMTSLTRSPCALANSSASMEPGVSASSHHGRCFSVPISARRTRSASLSIPTTLPPSSTTGSALMSCSIRSLIAEATSVSGLTVTTSRTITSIAFMVSSSTRSFSTAPLAKDAHAAKGYSIRPVSKHIDEQDIEAGRKRDGCGQRQHPRHQQVAHGCPLQPRAVGRHRSGYAGRQHVRGRNRKPVHVGGGDRSGGDHFGAGALAVGHVNLADFLADRDDDALPSDHRAESKRDRDRDLDPQGNELGCVVERCLVGG